MITSVVMSNLEELPTYIKYNIVLYVTWPSMPLILFILNIHRWSCLVSAASVGERTNLILIVTQAQCSAHTKYPQPVSVKLKYSNRN